MWDKIQNKLMGEQVVSEFTYQYESDYFHSHYLINSIKTNQFVDSYKIFKNLEEEIRQNLEGLYFHVIVQ